MMAATFRRFGEEVVMPLAEDIHRRDLTIPDVIIDGVRDLGCFGLSVPERFGGLLPDDGEDSLGMIVATEELSRASLGAAGSLITRPEIMARALLEGGTDEQKAEWLPRIAAGDPLVAISVTEPNTGSDVASVALRATRVEGGWQLNGAKTWCTFAGKAGVILVLVRTDPDPAAGHKGLSLFMVEKPSTDAHEFEFESPGGGRVSGRAIATIGYRGMHSYEMFYDDFFVPDSHVVGGGAGLGRGFYYQMRGFSGGRIQTAARATGLMQAAWERAVAYAGERQVFGRPVADYGLSRVKLARMATQLTASRLLTHEVGRMLDAGEGQMEASLVKLFACKAAEWVTREALQLHGGMGYAEESPVSRYWVDARVLSIFEGAEETLALKVVGRALLA
jgi:(2S)-methylsuccinyl-CoA dehydrogenase